MLKKLTKLFYLILILLGVVLFSGCTKTFDANSKITVYTRDTTSGTRDGFFTTIGFEDAISNNTVLASGYVEFQGNGDIISAVKNDIYGIGYISLSTLEESTLLGLNYNDIEPTIDNVLNESYLMKRNFNYITRTTYNNTKEEQIVQAFVAYMSTKEGKATIINNHGIVSVNANDPTWDSIKSQYPVTSIDNSNITIRFGGSTSVQKVAQALSSEFRLKCGNFVAEHNHTGSGDAYKRTQGSEKDGANNIHIGFASREFSLTTSEQASQGTYGKICIDAIVVVVNSKNKTISNVTSDTLKKIFDGTITLWKELE